MHRALFCPCHWTMIAIPVTEQSPRDWMKALYINIYIYIYNSVYWGDGHRHYDYSLLDHVWNATTKVHLSIQSSLWIPSQCNLIDREQLWYGLLMVFKLGKCCSTYLYRSWRRHALELLPKAILVPVIYNGILYDVIDVYDTFIPDKQDKQERVSVASMDKRKYKSILGKSKAIRQVQ